MVAGDGAVMGAQLASRRLPPDDRRRQILAQATRLFELRPYSEVSIGDIAEAAGVARALVHHYFGTKREIYLAVVELLSTLRPIELGDLSGNDSLPDVARIVTERIIEVIVQHREASLTMLSLTAAGADDDVRKLLSRSDDDLARNILSALGVGVGPAEAERLRGTAMVIGALSREAVRQWLVEGALTRQECANLLGATLTAALQQLVPNAHRATSPAAVRA